MAARGCASAPFPRPLWDGTDLGGKDVFLHAEQGLGDELFFLRFVPWLRKQGAGRIIYSPKHQDQFTAVAFENSLTALLLPPDERPTGTEFVFSVGDLPRLLDMEHPEPDSCPDRTDAFVNTIAAVRQQLVKVRTTTLYRRDLARRHHERTHSTEEIPLDKLAACLRGSTHTTVVVRNLPLTRQKSRLLHSAGASGARFSRPQREPGTDAGVNDS